MTFLPSDDHEYLKRAAIEYEEFDAGGVRGVIFRKFALPVGKYNANEADILTVLRDGYPDVGPDMFYANPRLNFVGGGSPGATTVDETFNGRLWQRWSRHDTTNGWRSGIDGIQTQVERIREALRVAA